MIDPRRLRFLLEVAERGTIAAAADALAYTPSAVSQQLTALEQEAGVELLERRGRGVALTAAGQVLVDHARRVLDAVEQAEAAVALTGNEMAGGVKVGGYASVASNLIPPAFDLLMQNHPGIELYFEHLAEDQLLRELRLGTIDVAVEQEYSHIPKSPEAGLDRNDLMSDGIYLALPRNLDADPLGPAGLAPLAGMHWAAGRDQEAGECRRAAEQLCRAAGFEPDVRYQTDDGVVILDIVAAGLAVAIIPGLAATRCPDGARLVPLPGLHRNLYALNRPAGSATAAVRAVVGALVEAAQHVESPDRRAA
jgi:DNA-binding transcriptional LysR family regulator